MGAIFVFTIIFLVVFVFFTEELPNYLKHWEENKPKTRRIVLAIAILASVPLVDKILQFFFL